jgi:curved DNA-binding protein CbpA
MLPDYYAVLGVAANASHKEIQLAFRERAKERHPDRGGSHAAMKQLLEAWEVLSNADSRRRYDEARAAKNDAVAQERAQADARLAQERATEYPPRWADFVNATYGTSGFYPTIDQSVSGT